MANVKLVSKTVPNKEYFRNHLEKLVDEGVIEAYDEDSIDAEQLMIYIARVSSSRDNKLEDYETLLEYLIDNSHWSPFQMADMTVEIETSRAIGRQLIRHRSFKFQEFSQRYSSDIEFEDVELRGQPENNRQSSSEVISKWFSDRTSDYEVYEEEQFGRGWESASNFSRLMPEIEDAYKTMIDNGVASETARMILPECTQTTLYMKGSVRSWMHYLDLRSKENTQKEHREVANEIGKIFQEEFPVTSKAMNFDYE